MTLPVSSYEELLVQVRGLTNETILLQRQLSSDLFDDRSINGTDCDLNHNLNIVKKKNYDNGKLLADSCDAVLQRQRSSHPIENNRRFDIGQNQNRNQRSFNLANNRIESGSSYGVTGINSTGGLQSGELTARLIAWQNCQLLKSSQARHRKEEDESEEEEEVEEEEEPEVEQKFGSFNDAIRPFGGAGITLKPPKCTALGSSRSSDAPSSQPAVATPQQQQQQQRQQQTATTSPQLQRRTQTRCTRGSLVRSPRPDSATLKLNKEDVMEPELKEKDERKSSTPSPESLAGRGTRPYNEDGSSEDESGPSICSRTNRLSSLYHGTWPVERGLWNSQQTGFSNQQSTSTNIHNDIASVMSFSSSVSTGVGCPGGVQGGMQGQRRLGAKVDVVYSLLGMLGGAEGREDMSATLLSMSSSMDSCLAMRQSGCLPLLVQLIHAPGQDPETRERASQAIHNIVHSRAEERAGRREARVLRLLEQLRDYCQTVRKTLEAGQPLDDFDRHPGPTIAALMKLSFDEAHRHAMCQLGGLHAVAELIEMDHAAHGSECDDQNCVTLRRYAGMALTNLTFGDGNNKALLCSFREFMKALVAQLRSPSDDLRQVTASVLRNLSWRADSSSKKTLREVGAVVGLTMAAIEGRKESTLKSILSALWNLSAHCSTNKIDICAVEGALAFLVDMLSYEAPSQTLAIVENAGGILRNVSSHVAVREDYRSILRERGCLQVLLRQLRSPSLTVVSNACGALWNLSARCPQDQRMLWDLGAVSMLRSLVHSKHKMISMGSSAALKNLLGARPGSSNLVHLDSTARGLGLPTLPTLVARRQRALEQEIDQNLSETCDNIEPSTSPTNKDDKFGFKVERRFGDLESRSGHSYHMQNSQPGPSGLRFNSVARSESRESIRSITSTHSDTIFERVNRHVLNGISPTESQLKQQSSSLHSATGFNAGIPSDGASKLAGNLDRKYVLRYKNAIPERQRPTNELSFNEIADLRCTTSTMSWASAADQEAACSQLLLRSSIEESSLSNELSKPIIASNRDDIKSHYLSKERETSTVARDNALWQNTSSNKNGEITGAIKRDVSCLSSSTDYRLRYAGCDLDDDEKQHSGYFAESEEELPLKDNSKTQYKSKSFKISREFDAEDGATAGVYESWKNQPFKERKYSFETNSLNSSEKRVNYHSDEASNSSTSIGSSLTATIIADKSSTNLTQKLNDCDIKVEAKTDTCTLNRVSGDERNRNFNGHEEAPASLTFQQYDSLDLLTGYDQDSSLASNSSQRLQSFTSINGPLDPPAERAAENNSQLASDSSRIENQRDRSGERLRERDAYAEPCSLKLNVFTDNFEANSLSLDDELKIANDSRLKECTDLSTAGISEPEEIGEPLNLSIGSILEDVEEDNETNEVENDRDYGLAACISREIETKRSMQPFRRSSLEKSPPQPVSNLARYQTSSALNHVDVAGPASPTTPTQSFRQLINEEKIVRDTEDAAGRNSPPNSPLSLIARERDMESADGYLPKLTSSDRNSSRDIPDVVLKEETRPDDSTVVLFDAAAPVFDDSELDSKEKISLIETEFIGANEAAPGSVSPGEEREFDESLTSGALDEDIVDANYAENEEEEYADRVEAAISVSMAKEFGNQNTEATNKTVFAFDLSIEDRTNAEIGEDVTADKGASSSPEVRSSKAEDDSEKTNASEEENLSDEVMSPTIDPIFSAVERAGNGKVDRSKNREEREEEEYRRQRDPDAMIASLDRLTAALVQQTEAMRERESSAMKQSVVSDTWNEDSPNDVSFPSISVSAPLIASFKSDNQEDQTVPMPDYSEEPIASHGGMTDSRIIEREANKLAEAVNARVAEFDFEALSMTSMDLDAIKPPSTMGSLLSLTTSLIGPIDSNPGDNLMLRERCNSASLPPAQLKGCQIGWAEGRSGRKKSLPAGVVARRALSQQQSHAGSLENLLNDASTCTSVSHLENVKPPSMMDELLDAMDMENSMLSVASITSEVADSKDQDSQSLTASDPVFDLLKPVANILSMTCMRYAESMQVSGNNSLSECLENINPPSLFNEVSEMDESTMEPTSETFCSDTLCIDQELGTEEAPNPREVSIERIEECDNDTDEAATPIPSEYSVTSSAESTPKKRPNKNHLTPKQKRQLAKERYKTYTIAAEMVKKEEEERRKHEHEESRIGKYHGAKSSPLSKLTPKQRRQEDRARFQTQVLNNPFPVLSAFIPAESQPARGDSATTPDTEDAGSTAKSGIPKLRKLSGSKTIKQKRAENKDRYRTRTLDDEEAQEASRDVDVITSGARFADSDTSLETMLHITPRGSESILGQVEDVLIDCETLSLVSNDSEPEHNSRLRLVHGIPRMSEVQEPQEENGAQGFVARFVDERRVSPSKSLPQDFESLEDAKPQLNSDSGSDEESNSANEQSMVPKRPRIVKPGAISRDASLDSNATDKSEAESPKTIRGRRKALYSNPTTRKSTPHTSPSKMMNGAISGIPIGRSNTTPLVRGTRATTLRQTHSPGLAIKGQQKSIFNSKSTSSTGVATTVSVVEKRTRGSAPAGNRTSIPQRGTVFNYSKSTKRHTTPSASFAPSFPPSAIKDEKKEPVIKPLERQGTFTKEEPEVENAPTVLPPCSPSKSKIAKPIIKTSPSKIQPPPNGKSKSIGKPVQNSQQKIGKISSLEKEQTKSSSSSSSTVVYQRRSLIGSPIKNSSSNQSLQSNDSGRVGKKSNALGQRSNSNSSIVSNSSTGVQGRRTTKEATSKIASLWKRVEESKTKQRFEKNDTRHWITPASGGAIDAGIPIVTSKPPTFRLIRSSTFEGVTKDVNRNGAGGKPKSNGVGKRQSSKVTEAQNFGPKYRNSCDLTGVSITEAPCKIPTKYPDTKLVATKKDTMEIGDTTIVLRKKETAESSADTEIDPTKRVSRLGSFIRVDPPEIEIPTNINSVRTITASAIVPPFNYNPNKQTSPMKPNINEIEGGSKLVMTECQVEITTSSMRVTTV